MKTDTEKKILAFIKKKGEATPKEIIAFIGFGAPAVFCQLKKLIQKGDIVKIGKPPRVLYRLPFSEKDLLSKDILQWTIAAKPDEVEPDFFCPTRDVFQARLDRMLSNIVRSTDNEPLSYLIAAVCGEIGNNSYDHNLGNWPDASGVYFRPDAHNRIIAIADRGLGVLATLRRVKPDIRTDSEALDIAFTKTISGRGGEQRGNGLKFVKKIVQEKHLTLRFYSGDALCYIDAETMHIGASGARVRGTAALLEF